MLPTVIPPDPSRQAYFARASFALPAGPQLRTDIRTNTFGAFSSLHFSTQHCLPNIVRVSRFFLHTSERSVMWMTALFRRLSSMSNSFVENFECLMRRHSAAIPPVTKETRSVKLLTTTNPIFTTLPFHDGRAVIQIFLRHTIPGENPCSGSPFTTYVHSSVGFFIAMSPVATRYPRMSMR
jgi:hypothetical protein